MNNEIRFITLVRYHIPYDICRFLIESIAIILAIPVSVLITSIIMKISSLKRRNCLERHYRNACHDCRFLF